MIDDLSCQNIETYNGFAHGGISLWYNLDKWLLKSYCFEYAYLIIDYLGCQNLGTYNSFPCGGNSLRLNLN